MKVLVTGGAGFIGARLARTLLARGALCGRRIEQLVLADQAPPRAELERDARVRSRTGRLLDQIDALRTEPFDAVFHLASAVSGECELDFDLGMASNLDSTRALLDALRHRVTAHGAAPTRLVFSSSIAVFGQDPAHADAFPAIVGDHTLPTPQTSYGTQKLVCEQLIADYTRKGFVDGRSARLVTVTVRPGRPNGAASSFFSGIVREPLAGQQALLPVDAGVAHPVASPQRMVDGLIAVCEASREALGGRTALNLPSSTSRWAACSTRSRRWPAPLCARASGTSPMRASRRSSPAGRAAWPRRVPARSGCAPTRASSRSSATTSTTAPPRPAHWQA